MKFMTSLPSSHIIACLTAGHTIATQTATRDIVAEVSGPDDGDEREGSGGEASREAPDNLDGSAKGRGQ